MSIAVKVKTKKEKKNKNTIQKQTITFSRKHVTGSSVISIIFAGISLLSFIGMCIYSAVNKGDAGPAAGIVPIFAMILDLAGIVLAYVNFRRENIKMKYVTIGAVSNALLLIFYLFLYLTGI